MKIAKIDFRSPEAPSLFTESLRDTGFAVINHHSIKSDLIHDVYGNWALFFASSEKFEHRFNPKDQSGYFPFRSENAKGSSLKDLKEFYHVFPGTRLPSGMPSSTLVLRDELMKVAQELLKWLQAECPVEVRSRFSESLPAMIEGSSGNLLRILHYPPIPGDVEAGAVRAAAHEDINLITLLPAATQPGLQVKDRQGNWHEVPCDPGDIVVNGGDMLQMASGGYFRSTTHRVVNPDGEEAQKSRYSAPIFIHPRQEVILAPGVTAQTYLEERLREIGLKS